MTTTASLTYQSLLRAVCESPHEDAVRLILADWLDDNDQPTLAEFIRVQMDLADLPATTWFSGLEVCLHTQGRKLCYRCAALRAREAELFTADWLPMLDGSLREWWLSHRPDDATIYNPYSYLVRRGFVETVWCSLADWLAHGKAIVEAQPVSKVVLAGKTPHPESEGVYSWNKCYSDPINTCTPEAGSCLPDTLLRLMEAQGGWIAGDDDPGPPCDPFIYYPSRDAALSALSLSALNHARHAAALPPLAPG